MACWALLGFLQASKWRQLTREKHSLLPVLSLRLMQSTDPS